MQDCGLAASCGAGVEDIGAAGSKLNKFSLLGAKDWLISWLRP
jgi:hypothetical protein